MTDPECPACNINYDLKPCPFCGQPVMFRYNSMTGEHYIMHKDWNSRCPQRPFYGDADQWNMRYEDGLRAEIIKWIEAVNAGTKLINEQRAIIQKQDEHIEWLQSIIQAAHDTFTQGGTDPADDEVISGADGEGAGRGSVEGATHEKTD